MHVSVDLGDVSFSIATWRNKTREAHLVRDNRDSVPFRNIHNVLQVLRGHVVTAWVRRVGLAKNQPSTFRARQRACLQSR